MTEHDDGKPFCGCGDEIVAADPGLCGTCAAMKLDEIERLRAEIATRQAREAKLREALIAVTDDLSGVIGEMSKDGESMPVIQQARAALALPADDTALREMIAKMLDEVADEAPIDGNSLAQVRVRMKAEEIRARGRG